MKILMNYIIIHRTEIAKIGKENVLCEVQTKSFKNWAKSQNLKLKYLF